MNLNVDSFCQIDYSDNESVKSDYSNCSSVASVSSQLSTAGVSHRDNNLKMC